SVEEYADWVAQYIEAGSLRSRGSGIGDRGSVLPAAPIPDPHARKRVPAIPGTASVVLNGHSMGGAIALTLALRRPAWLRAIVLTGTGARLRVLPRLLELLRTDYPAAVDLIVEQSFAPPPPGGLTYAQRAQRNGTKRQLLRTPQAVTLGDYEACDRFDVMPRL